MNRFHNKYHKHNHHTDPTLGDIDSANDPIASADSPFLGNFNLSGDLIADGDMTATNATVETLEADTVSTDTLGSNVTSEVTLNSDLNLNGKALNGSTLDTIGDVQTSGKVLNDVLKWDGANWVNDSVPIAPNSITMSEIDESIFGVGLTVNAGQVDSTSTTPVGGMIMWMADALPTGWLECNGQGLDPTTYPELFTLIGEIYGTDVWPNPTEFYLPDMRGMFPRGLDSPARGGSYGDPDGGSGRASSTVDGVDGPDVKVGRNVGTKQDDALQDVEGRMEKISETWANGGGTATGAFQKGSSPVGGKTPDSTDSSATGSVDFRLSYDLNARTSTETRPNNVYVRFIMKATP